MPAVSIPAVESAPTRVRPPKAAAVPSVQFFQYPYGIVTQHSMCRREVEYSAFKLDLRPPKGLGKFEHLHRAVFSSYPEFVAVDNTGKRSASNRWNPWMERTLRAMCSDEYAVRSGDSVFRCIVLTGCGGASKTWGSGLYAVNWWGCAPGDSIAILTSTTKDMIRHRIWPVVQHFHDSAVDVETGRAIEIGHMIDSELSLQASKKDRFHAIFALAVACGETQKALHNLKGMHAPRMLLVIDEANGTPQAIFEAIPNLRKTCKDFTLVIIGNPTTRLDPHGRSCEPIDGWGSVGIDSMQWRTKAIPEWAMESGVCLRFDGAESPNVKAGRDLYPHIYGIEDWRGAQSREGTFAYWSQDRGFWPPEGFQNTVFTEQLLVRADAMSHYKFMSKRRRLAFLDPAFGGDVCVLQFAELGDVENGKLVLQLGDWLEVPIAVEAAAHDVDYQIARRVIEECKARDVNPYCFGLDATGIGRGVGAIIAAEWSPQIQYMSWGVGATDRPSAQNDGRPSSEVYATFVTELWFSARELLEAQQVKGFSRESVSEFCAREYEMNGKKYKMETKDDMKHRLRYSPDHADAVVGIVEVARRNGLEIAGRVGAAQATQWEVDVRKAQDDSPYEVQIVSDGADWGSESIW